MKNIWNFAAKMILMEAQKSDLGKTEDECHGQGISHEIHILIDPRISKKTD